jgi:two-component system response regulator HydG
MRSGAFRDDLYYRLRVIEITIPPLRERKDDILPLARFFAQRLSEKLDMPNLRLDAKSLDYLLAHPWPGNVRELENAIEHAAVLSRNGLVLPEFLPGEIVRATGAPPAVGDPVRRTLAEVARDHIAAVLEFTDGNKSRAAKILGISPATLWRKQKRMEQD